MAFLQWRALVARAAGYEMEIQVVEDVSFEAPVLPLDGVTIENARGEWGSPPEDILLVLLIHMSHEGVISPAHAGTLADKLEFLMESGALGRASYAADNSIARHLETLRTEQFVSGLRLCAKTGEPITFLLWENSDEVD